MMTLSTRDIRANTAASGTRDVLIPAFAKVDDVSWPVNLGAVSLTMTSKFVDYLASVKKSISVLLVWYVKITSLSLMCSVA